MKRFIVFVVMMMSITSVSAQRWSLTPEVGATAVLRKVDLVNVYEQNWEARWKMGLGVEYQIRPAFSLKSGLYYTQRGCTSRFLVFGSLYPTQENQSTPTFGEGSEKTNLHFLQVPLMANFSIRLADQLRLNLGVGPYAAYLLGDKSTGQYFEHTWTGNTDNGYGSGWTGQWFDRNYKMNDLSFDWGLSLQAGLEIGSCVMNVGYDVSLGKEYEYDSVGLKYHTLSLSVGYKFKLGK